MTEVKVIDLLMCQNGKLYSDCFRVLYGSSITFLIDSEFTGRTVCLWWANSSSGELCCLVTALVSAFHQSSSIGKPCMTLASYKESLVTICWQTINPVSRLQNHTTQGINDSAILRFLQRLSVIFGFHRDCLWSLAWLTVQEKWLPAETFLCVILLPAETLGRKLSHMDSLYRKLFIKHNSLGRKQEITDSLSRSQIWRTVSSGSVK